MVNTSYVARHGSQVKMSTTQNSNFTRNSIRSRANSTMKMHSDQNLLIQRVGVMPQFEKTKGSVMGFTKKVLDADNSPDRLGYKDHHLHELISDLNVQVGHDSHPTKTQQTLRMRNHTIYGINNNKQVVTPVKMTNVEVEEYNDVRGQTHRTSGKFINHGRLHSGIQSMNHTRGNTMTATHSNFGPGQNRKFTLVPAGYYTKRTD